jgi:hypothetical protein
MHPAESICFVSSLLKRNRKKTGKKKKRKRKEKDDKSEEEVPPRESYCDSLESNFHVSEVSFCQAVNKIGFFRAGEGPKYTQGKQVAVLSI